MMIRMKVLDGIRAGEITQQFRRQRRPTVKTGGTLRTARGVLAIDAVDVVDEAALTPADATAAGFASVADLRASLTAGSAPVYRIALHWAGEDPRHGLREQAELAPADLAALRQRLQRLERAGPWVRRTLELIEASPGVAAAELAAQLGMERQPFKTRVRRLKDLGLTIALAVGYRLAPRGQALLGGLRAADAQPKV